MKRLIPKNHCISIVTWCNDEFDPNNPNEYQGFKNGMSAMQTGAGSLNKTFKIIKEQLKQGHTHFLISYPIAMSGNTSNEIFNIHNLDDLTRQNEKL